jgi:hypothetical protein
VAAISAFFTALVVIPALCTPLQRHDKIAQPCPNVIMTVDRVAAQQHGSVVLKSAKTKIGSLVIG